MKAALALLLLSGALSALAGCEREQRRFLPPGEAPVALNPVPGAAPLHEGPTPLLTAYGDYEQNAYAIAQGRQLYNWFNCSGCHAAGGGGIGPPLMDAKWRYGHEPGAIFASIAEGRPNGMPSFGSHLPEAQIWQLVAYVRSMSLLVPQDAAPGRDDGLQKGEPEQRREPVAPEREAVGS